MTVITHLWPSISPWNIWELPVGVFWGYADAADDWTTPRASQTK